jgi:hypothetical protein
VTHASCHAPNCSGKGKAHPRTGQEDPEEEQWYSSTLSVTSVLDGGEGGVSVLCHVPAALHPGGQPNTYCVGG